jgi:DNA-directed RNA polymerase subunit RPC12/RpoP
MEVIGVLVACLLIGMGFAGLMGLVTGVYPIFSIWTGLPGRVASLFLFLPVLVSFLIAFMGWLGPSNSPSYNVLNVVTLVGGTIVSLLAGWVVDNMSISPVSQREAVNTCANCGREILTNDQVMREQSLLVQVGQAQQARIIEQQTGYRCKSCGRQYCKGCLERSARPNLSGGRACPACGGDFEYM